MKRKEYRDKKGQKRCLFCGKRIFMRRVFCSDLHSSMFTNLMERVKEMENDRRSTRRPEMLALSSVENG